VLTFDSDSPSVSPTVAKTSFGSRSFEAAAGVIKKHPAVCLVPRVIVRLPQPRRKRDQPPHSDCHERRTACGAAIRDGGVRRGIFRCGARCDITFT
jgi:hypothetical protein